MRDPIEPTLTSPAEVNGRFVTATHGGQFQSYSPADGETFFFDGPWEDALDKVRALPPRLFPVDHFVECSAVSGENGAMCGSCPACCPQEYSDRWI